jgi:hypothetical protein
LRNTRRPPLRRASFLQRRRSAAKAAPHRRALSLAALLARARPYRLPRALCRLARQPLGLLLGRTSSSPNSTAAAQQQQADCRSGTGRSRDGQNWDELFFLFFVVQLFH